MMSREKRDYLNILGLQFVDLWMIGTFILSIVQIAAKLTIPAEIYIALVAPALLIVTLASASQSGTIARDQDDGIEYTSGSKTIFRLGFFRYIWLNVLLVGIVFLYIYSEDYHSERIEKIKYESPRNVDQQLYILFHSLLILTGVVSFFTFCLTKMANRA